MISRYLPIIAMGLAGLKDFFSGALPVPSQHFNMAQINKARKLNQRAKAHKRGVPTAGNSTMYCGMFYCDSKPYINPDRQSRKALKRKFKLSGKSIRRLQKKGAI